MNDESFLRAIFADFDRRYHYCYRWYHFLINLTDGSQMVK